MKLTFVGPLISTFVKNDVAILSKEFELDIINADMGKGASAVTRLLKLHWKILSSVSLSDGLFFWFADYYTLLPTLYAKLLKKPVFVVAGGFDVTYLPELGVGARARLGRWLTVKNTFKQATRIFPVSMDTQKDLDSAVPDHAPSTMIYNTVDTSTYSFRNDLREENRVLTVSQADSVAELKRKGIDRFIEISRVMPEYLFVLAGLRGQALEAAQELAKGIEHIQVIPGRVPLDELLVEFWRAKVYAQFSLEERFGVSVAEAMSCGCIPIITPVNALHEVVGDVGVKTGWDIADQKKSLQEAMGLGEDASRASVERSLRFDITVREKELLGALAKHFSRNPKSVKI